MNSLRVVILLAISFLLAGFQSSPGISSRASYATGNMQVKSLTDAKLCIASCQFPVSADIRENYRWIRAHILESKLRKADIVHFPECALSGYPGADMNTLEGYNWDQLFEVTDSVIALAKELKIWVLLGSMHKLSGNNKPHNSLYVIDPEGNVVDRYDKRFCTAGDLKFFSPGDHFVNFTVNGINCGLLICYDIRFPELYRHYSKAGTQVLFQSFYNARGNKGSVHPVIMHVTAQAMAGSNHYYMSLTNSSAAESWPCYFITPDGLVQNRLELNVPGILISNVDISKQYYDASKPFRNDAIDGKLNSGELVKDQRSVDRKSIR